jgi:hypothetical protein
MRWGAGTYLYLPFGADVKALASERSATFFVITLPMLADIAAARRAAARNAGCRGCCTWPEAAESRSRHGDHSCHRRRRLLRGALTGRWAEKEIRP